MNEAGRHLTRVAADENPRATALLEQRVSQLEAELAQATLAEQDLRRRAAELTAFLETAAIGLHRVGPAGTILWANAAELDMLGYAADEYIGRHVAEFHVDRPAIDDILARLHRGEPVREFEARLRCKDGSIKDVLIDSTALREQGAFVHSQCFTRDVTARRAAEEQLRASEDRMRQLMSLLPAAVYTCDAAGRITFFNRRAVELWGREPQLHEEDQKFCGAFRLRRMDGTVMAHADSPMARAIQLGETTRRGEVIIERPDGSQLIVGVNIDPLYDGDRNRSGAINVFEDITERKQIEGALRESQQAEAARRAELETLMETVPAAVWFAHDPECRRITGNRFGHQTLGVPEGRNLSMTAPPDERPGEFTIFRNGKPVADHDLPMQRAGRTGEPVRGDELEHRLADGTTQWLYGSAVPLLDADRTVRGVIAAFMDITTRKQAEEELRRAKEQLARANSELELHVQERTASLREAIAQMEEFSYTVSHDLRAPVRAMHGYAQVLLEDYGESLDEKGREYLERIARGGERMDRLIQDILTYSRLPLRDVQVAPVSLDAVVREIVANYAVIQPPRADVRIQHRLPSVLGNEPLLVQVVSNLLDNAVKFVVPGTTPRVRIRTEQNNGAVRLWIEDNGIGIRPEAQQRIFGLFERVHPESRFEGTGIGLAIVRKAVERMGGRVGFRSDGITGTSFWIELAAIPNE